MFQKGISLSVSTAVIAALLLSTGTVRGERLTRVSRVDAVSSTPVAALKECNAELDVPLRGRQVVLHSYLPIEIGEDAPIVLYSSGSGGWHDFDQYLATTLANRGMPVFGISTHSYLRKFFNDKRPATPDAVANDYVELIKQAKQIAKVEESRPVILAGWSLGAGYAPLIASDPRVKADVLGVISLSLSRDNETALTVSHRLMSRLTGRTVGPSFDVVQYLTRVAPVPVAIIQAAKDRTASPRHAQQLMNAVPPDQSSTLRLFEVAAGRTHSFAGGRSQVNQTLDEVIAWIRSKALVGSSINRTFNSDRHS